MSLRKRITIPLLSIGAVVFILGVITLLSPSFRINYVEGTVQTIMARMQPTPIETFPTLDGVDLLPLQQRIIDISKQEYAKKPVSFDATVMKYSQNHKESWCADYVSWVLKQAGQPLSNPNSGSWRIPGTGTMHDYFIAQNIYEKAGRYTPKVGDVAIYRHNRSHVNLVIAVNGNKMTTIGGNENGHLRLNTQSYTFGTQGLSGFGKLDSTANTK